MKEVYKAPSIKLIELVFNSAILQDSGNQTEDLTFEEL